VLTLNFVTGELEQLSACVLYFVFVRCSRLKMLALKQAIIIASCCFATVRHSEVVPQIGPLLFPLRTAVPLSFGLYGGGVVPINPESGPLRGNFVA
jgi:hypothetical protein